MCGQTLDPSVRRAVRATSWAGQALRLLRAAAFAVAVVGALAGCQPASGPQPVAAGFWAQERLLFLGDPRSGQVRVLRLGAQVMEEARLLATGRLGTRAIHVDVERGQLWILGEQTLHVHDGRTGALIAAWAAPRGVLLARLRLRDGRPEVTGSDSAAYDALQGDPVLRRRS